MQQQLPAHEAFTDEVYLPLSKAAVRCCQGSTAAKHEPPLA